MGDNCNGRVNLMEDNKMLPFHLYDKIPTGGGDNFYQSALIGNWKNNTLSDVYFSSGNIEILHNAIIAGVHRKSNGRFLISRQDTDTLKMIMRSIFLQHSKNLPDRITEQVEQLNKMVVDYAVPQIIGEANGFIKYKNDASMMYTPIERPSSTYVNNTLEAKSWF